jgi:hypothetical protein
MREGREVERQHGISLLTLGRAPRRVGVCARPVAHSNGCQHRSFGVDENVPLD